MQRHKSPADYITAHPEYKSELTLLRKLCNANGLTETIKWGAPVYTDANNKNVIGLGAFKSYIGLWFFQGSFLKDSKKKLMNAQEGTTRGMRQLRFTDLAAIKADEKLITAYIKEALANSLAGKEIKPKRTAGGVKVDMPDELASALKKNAKAKKGFDDLSPYKQKEYTEYISGAKREATKLSRLDKILPMLADGVGLNDKYR